MEKIGQHVYQKYPFFQGFDIFFRLEITFLQKMLAGVFCHFGYFFGFINEAKCKLIILISFLLQVFGIFCTMAAEQLLSHTGNDLLANGMLAGVLLLGTILTALINADYRRQAASKPQGNLLRGIDNKIFRG